ncbi:MULTISPECIES: DNA adenine methylase [Glycomyces]|uniref:DNA adenine methylase n=2 Tax=Glycomyces TaxID=58113 RepID=A0ABU2AIA0_9ACTN|nr:DNA adenine methylase [Glycomyces lechevalierae]MDR7336805.1 DNA adenine methylase [Glycomyces lechevalierae]
MSTEPTRPPIAYFGGKMTIADRIVSFLPPHEHYVEPYCGSCAVLLAKPRSRMETVNDIDLRLMRFWRVLRDQPAKLARVIDATPHSRAEFAPAAEVAGDDLEDARRVWVLLTQSRTGTMRPSGWRHYQSPKNSSFGMPAYLDTYRTRLPSTVQRMQGVSLEALPALDVIAKYGRHEGVLLYVDPPYLGSTRTRGYLHEMHTDADHEALAEALHACKAAVVLSGYPSDLYDHLYYGWDRVEIQTGTGQSGTWSSRTEVLWSNRPLAQQSALFELEATA